MTAKSTHYRTCNICEAMCGLAIEHENGSILSIKADKEDPFSMGHICPKAIALQDFNQDPQRLKTPMKKVDGVWQEISWEEGIATVKQKIREIQAAHGPDSVGIYLGNPNAHNFGNAIMLPAFFKAVGSKNRFSSASADQLPHHVASNYMFGAGMLIPVPDIDRTGYMLIIGANPLVSNGSMMTAPAVGKRLKAIQARGGKVVVMDPRRTETAKQASEHHFIRPGTDALLLMALIHTLFDEDLVKPGHLFDRLTGVEDMAAAVQSYSPEAVSKHCGVSAAVIRTIAREMSAAESAVCYSRMGASTQAFGGLCLWLTYVFNILTDNLDREGGAMFPEPAFDLLANKRPGGRSSYGRFQSRVRELPYFNSEFPVATLADEILEPGEGQIRALFTIAGNPVLSAPGGDKLAAAFDSLDFMVSIDIYLNETTQHADLILPSTTGLETAHFDVFFNSFAVRNTVKYSEPLYEKSQAQRHDWEILKALTNALLEQDDDGLTPQKVLDLALRNGRYRDTGLSLDQLKAHPHGMDLGPLRPCLTQRLLTADGVIHLAPEFYLADLPRLNELMRQDPSDEMPMVLIGRRLVRSHNTWTQNSYRLVKGKNPVTLQISPQDAGALQLSDGEVAEVTSSVGRVHIPVEVTDDLMPGVVSMPQGWGHADAEGMSVAAKQPGVSINSLTDGNRVDPLTGNAAFNGTPVSVQRLMSSGSQMHEGYS